MLSGASSVPPSVVSDAGPSTGHYIIVPLAAAGRTNPTHVPPSPMRKISIYTEGDANASATPWLTRAASTRSAPVRASGADTGDGRGATGRYTPAGDVGPSSSTTHAHTRQALRASPLVWSVVDEPLQETRSPRTVPPLVASARLSLGSGRADMPPSYYHDGDGLADTPLNHSFAEPLDAADEPPAQRQPQPVPTVRASAVTSGSITQDNARPPLPPPSPSSAVWPFKDPGPQATAATSSAPAAPASSSSSPCAPCAAAPTATSSASQWCVPLTAGPLGPLWTVRTIAEGASTDKAADAADDAANCVAALQALSREREVSALRRQVDDAQAETEAVRRQAAATAESAVEDLLRTRRDEERRRRQQFQETLDALREENRELTAALDAQRRSIVMGLVSNPNNNNSGEGGGRAIPAALEAEWARRLDEVEAYWRERLRTAERHWAKEMDEQLSAQKREQHQLRDAQRAAAEMQERLRHVEAESAHLTEQIERRLGLPLASLLQSRGSLEWVGDSATAAEVVPWESVPQLVQEVRTLRVAAVEHTHREAALLAQLDGYSEEAVRLQLTLEKETQRLRREVESERSRNAELVRLYGGQVQTLHAQLKDALREKKELVEALRTLQ